jgi:hypothetical protein
MYWFIRLLVLTDATSPRSAVEVNTDSLAQSLPSSATSSAARSTRRGHDGPWAGAPSRWRTR